MLEENLSPGSLTNSCPRVSVTPRLSVSRERLDSEGGTYNRTIRDAVGLAPARHDEGVIVREEDDFVHALGLELILVLDVGGQVGCGARGGEGAGDGNDDDLLVGELCPEAPVSYCYRAKSEIQELSGRKWELKRKKTMIDKCGRTSRRVVVLGNAAGAEILELGSVGNVGEGHALGESVSSLEFGHFGGLQR